MDASLNDIVASTVSFSTSQTLTTSSNKSTTFNLVTPTSFFATVCASLDKDTDHSLKKINTINADSYIDSAYEKSQIVRFNNDILQNLIVDIKTLSDKFLKWRCEDLIVKSSDNHISQIKHSQEALRSKDGIINKIWLYQVT